jgi:hypothetical protein
MLNQNDIAMLNQDILTVEVVIHLCAENEKITVRFQVDNSDESLNRFKIAREESEQIDNRDIKMGPYYRKVMAIFFKHGFERNRAPVAYAKEAWALENANPKLVDISQILLTLKDHKSSSSLR